MARFHFRLEPVLNYRASLEERAKEELAGSLARYQREKQALEELAEDLSAHTQPVECGRLDLTQLTMLESYQRYLELQLERQSARVQAAEEAVSKCRRKLEQKMQERKAVEILKEKQYNEFVYREEREEQKFLDDMATLRFVRQTMEK
ncbi:MAG TPA: flagellar export protein FliJ [Clostridia bacterium]|nr:flagellar export protein FliJ [Clostridia bacterium]